MGFDFIVTFLGGAFIGLALGAAIVGSIWQRHMGRKSRSRRRLQE